MGMKDNPGSGYVIALEELKKALPSDQQAELDRVIEETAPGDADQIAHWLRPVMKRLGFPEVEMVWYFDDEGQSDDLESSQFYVSFAETDLFRMTPKAGFKRMRLAGVEPKLCNWTEWG